MHINRWHFPIVNYPPWKDYKRSSELLEEALQKLAAPREFGFEGAAWGGRGWQWGVRCSLLCMCSVLAWSRSPALSLGAQSPEPRLGQRCFQGHPLLRQGGSLSAPASRDFTTAVHSGWEFVSLFVFIQARTFRSEGNTLSLSCFNASILGGGVEGWNSDKCLAASFVRNKSLKQSLVMTIVEGLVSQVCWWLIQPEVTQQPRCGWQSWCCFCASARKKPALIFHLLSPGPARRKGLVKVIHSVLGRQRVLSVLRSRKVPLVLISTYN